MQKLVSNDNGNSNSSMPPQVQVAPQAAPQMQSFQQPPFQPLGQLNQMQDWQNQQHQQPSQGQLPLSSPSPPLPNSPKLSSSNVLPKQEPPSSPTGLSLVSGSSSAGNSKSSKTGGSKQVSQQASSSSPHHQIRRGSGVDIKGPTPEVAQQLRFPWKLHLLLERCEYEHQQKLAACVAEGTNPASIPDMPISWLPCGKSFKVHDKERFVREVMPSFFGTQSFKTFQRNLNLWGFTRVSKGPQKDVCSHPLFLKGFPAVCQSMKRIVLKGTGRGNRAPLGGVDVSSVQAVVAAAAMQQARQQAQQQQQASGMNAISNGGAAHQQQQMQAQPPKSTDITGMTQQNTLTHFHQQNQQQQQQQQVPQNHHQQYVIENGSILPAPMPSQQKLVVLPSQPNPNASATTSVMWPNTLNQPLQQQQMQQPQGNNADLQKSLQQLSAILQQLNGCNALSSASVNTNSVNTNTNSSNANNFQQPQQPLQLAPTPLPNMMMQPQQQQQQQTVVIQPPSNPNTVVAPSPMSTQDLVALLLQRNLQQQVSQVQANTTQPQQQPQQIQLQVPTSLFPSGTFAAPQPAPQAPQQPPASVNNPYTTTNTTNYAPPPPQQQQGAMMGNNSNSYQQQAQQVATSPSPNPVNGQQQQQNQLLQLLLQQNGWSTSSSA